MRVYSYKIVRDYGFAPNPYHGFCSLATCKPKIRKSAQIGDLVIGCGSIANGRAGQIICALKITSKIDFQRYWDDAAYLIKRPSFQSSSAHGYGDNIYRRSATGKWLQERSHHSFPDGGLNEANLLRDTTTSEMVLLSTDFVYFGASSIDIPSHLRNFKGEDLYPNTRDYAVNFSTGFVVAIDEWFNGLPRGVHGRPIDWP